jgi:hypothetical protein
LHTGAAGRRLPRRCATRNDGVGSVSKFFASEAQHFRRVQNRPEERFVT